MPNSVDTRIVEMQFDNAKFERKVRQTIDSLEELDRSLKMEDAGKGFEKMEKAANSVDFSKMEKSLSFLEYRFTALGMTSAKIIDRMTSKIGGLFKSLEANTIGQIKSGGMSRALKLEHANFMLDGILKDAQKVKDIMDNAVSPAVDGTAYGLDAAANAASQFVAAGLTDIDKLRDALTGISGVAAMSGASYEEIAHIFTKVASSGRAMGDTFMELSTRGINATAVLANYMKVSAAEVEEMRKKGQINFEMFADAMNKAYGEQAKKANDTFEGALANMKAALSRIGADFATPYLNNMREIFNALRLTINDVKKALQPLVSVYVNAFEKLKDFTVALLENERFAEIYQNGIAHIIEVIRLLSELLGNVGDGFKQAFPEGLLAMIAKGMKNITKFLKSLEVNKRVIQSIADAVGGLFSILKLAWFVIQQIFGITAPFGKALNVILGTIVNIIGAIGKAITEITNIITKSDKASNIFSKIGRILKVTLALMIRIIQIIALMIREFLELPVVQQVFDAIYDSAMKLANYALPLIVKGAELLAKAFGVIIAVGKGGASVIFDAFTSAIGGFINVIKSGGGFVQAFFSLFTGGFKNIPRTVHAATGAVTELKKVVSDNGTGGGIVDKLSTWTDGFTQIKDSLLGFLDLIKKRVDEFGLGKTLLTGYSAALIALLVQGSRLAGSFTKAMKGVPKLISSVSDAIKAPLYDKKAKAVIIGIAVTLLSLAAALFVLTKTDTKKLQDVTACLLKLIAAIGAIGLISQVLGKWFSPKAFESFGIGLLAFTGAIAMLAGALKMISTIQNVDGLYKFVNVLVGIMVTFGVLLAVMSRIARPVSVIFGSTFVLAFTYGIKMLVEALAKLTDLPYAKVKASMDMMVEVMKAMAVVLLSASLINPFAAVGFIGMVGGILLLVEGVILLKDYLDPTAFKMVSDFLNNIYKEIKTWLILLAIGGIIKNTGKAIKGVIDSVHKFFVTPFAAFQKAAETAATALKRFATAGIILSIALFVKEIASAISVIGKLSPAEVDQGAIIVGGIVVAFMGVMSWLAVLDTLVGKNGGFIKDIAKSAFGISAMLLSVSLALKIIGEIPPENISGALETMKWIGIGLLAFEGITLILSKIGGHGIELGIKTALALSVLIGTLALCTSLMSMIVKDKNWTPLITAAGALAIVMAGMGVMCALMSKIKVFPALAAAAGLALVIYTTANALAMFKDMPDTTKIYDVVLGMVLAIGIVAGLLKLISFMKTGEILKGILGLAGVVAALYGAAIALQQLEGIDFVSMVPNLAALGSAFVVLSLNLAALGFLSWSNILKGTIGMAAVVASLYGGALALQQLAKINFNDMLPNLGALGVAIVALSMTVAGLGLIGWDTVLMGVLGLGGVVLALYGGALAMQELAKVNFNALLPNLIALGAAIAVLSGIVLLLGNFVTQTVIGEIALVGLLLIMDGLANVGAKLAAIDAQGMLTTIEYLGIAIGGLTAITLALGALILGTGGIAALLMGVGAIVLLLFAEIMAIYAHVGSAFAKACVEVGEALPVFSAGLEKLGEALSYFAGKDFDGILTNLASAMATIEGLSWMKDEAENVANAVSTLATAIYDLDDYTINITNDAELLNTAVSAISTAIDTLVNDIGKLPETLRNAFVALSSSNLSSALGGFANALMSASDEKMPAVGRKFALDILSGLKSCFTEQAASCVHDFVGGLQAGVEQNSDWAFNVGLALAQQFVEGFRSKDGIDSHSNAKEAIRAIIDWVGGLFQGQQEQSAKTTAVGTAGAKDLVTGFKNEIKDSTPAVVQTFQDMIGDVNANVPAIELDVVTNPDALAQKLLGSGGDSVFSGLFNTKTSRDIQNESNDKQRRDMEIARKMQQGLIKVKKESTEAAVEEANALAKNSKATGGSTKAKKENKEANEKKTEAIDEETGALEEETESAEDNREEILALAEAIEVVTKEFDKSFNHLQSRDNFKIVKNLTKAFSTFWSKGLGEDGWKKASQINKAFKQVNKTIKGTTQVVKKGVYAFDETGKYAGKLAKKVSNSAKQIETQVMKTGKTAIKVAQGQATVFNKVGNSVQKTTMRVAKNVKNLGNYFNELRQFQSEMEGIDVYAFIHDTGNAYDYITKLRQIEKYFTKFSKMPQKIQNFMLGINEKLSPLNDSLNALGRRIDGVGSYISKSAQSTAYVQDAFISLAATLYDGSEAANEYETEHARLLFLLENGEATVEEVEEHFQSYISRIMKALEEYRNSIEENLRGSFDIWSEFDKKLDDSNKNFLDTIESQIAGYSQWSNMLFELSKRGVDMNILKMLTDEGVSSYGKLKSLLGMTANQIALFNQRYAESETAITQARDTALAALANATTRASQRAAAENGKIAKAQLKQSKKVAKQLLDDAKAVAETQARYRAFNAREEKQYMDSLTEIERQAYKERLKEVKKAMKAEQKMAKKEETKRAREKKVEGILAEVKSFEKLRKIYHKYMGDTKMLSTINKQVAKSLENIKDKIKKFDGRSVKQMNYSWLAFAETLESTGNEANDYLTEMSERLEKFIEEVENATKAGNDMFNTFEKADSQTFSQMYAGIKSQILARSDMAGLFNKVIKMGFSQDAISYLNDIKSDLPQFYATLESWAKMTTNQVALTNESIALLYSTTNNLNEILENGFANTTAAAAKIAVEDAQRNLNNKKSKMDQVTKDSKSIITEASKNKTALQKELTNIEKQINSYQVQLGSKNLSKKERQTVQNTISTLNNERAAALSQLNEADKKIAQANEAIEKANLEYEKAQATLNERQQRLNEESSIASKQYILTSAKEKLKAAENEVKAARDAVNANNKTIINDITQWQNELNNWQARLANATKNKDKKAQNEAKAQIANISQQIAAAQAKLNENTNSLTKAQVAYDKALKDVNEAQAEYNKVSADQKTRAAIEQRIQDILVEIKSYEALSKTLRNYRSDADLVKRINQGIKDSVSGISGAIDQFGKHWKNITNLSLKDTNSAFSEIANGFLRFADTLAEANEEFDTFDDYIAARKQALSDYRDTLYDTIKGQVNLFEEFKRYSGEEATSADTYLANMESQLTGLEDWLTNLETLAKRGVSGDIIAMFASEGQNSFEKVAAFASASEDELVELVGQFARYQELLDEAADRAMATVGSSYTDAALAATEALLKQFKGAIDRSQVEEEAYETGVMIINGVKDGIGHVMPELMADVADSAEEAAAKKAGAAIGQAINNGIVKAISDNVASTVNAAIEKFKMAVDSVNSYVQENLQSEYTITIHVNTSEIDAAVARMNAAINGINANAGATQQAVVTSQANQQTVTPQVLGSEGTTNNVTLNYTQNNTSPVALSRTEIYRQTQNQLSTINGAINAAMG